MVIIPSFLIHSEIERERGRDPIHHICLLEQFCICKEALPQPQGDFHLIFAVDCSASEGCRKLEAVMGHDVFINGVFAVLFSLWISGVENRILMRK